MTRTFRLTVVCALAFLSATIARSATSKDIDAAFTAFWNARTPQDAAKMAPAITDSGVSFGDALKRLKAGRPYSGNVPKGVVKASYHANGTEFSYAVNIPESYDPARRYQVRIQLHGGVSRPGNEPRGNGTIGALAGAEQIYIIPYAWNDAPWWGDAQIENIGTILDTVKRTYNVDENHVVVAGVSDGGTGTYYIAMRDTTPFASFLPLNGFIRVLGSVDVGDLFPNNLLNKPFFAVNGGKDPLYPTEIVGPYVEYFKKNGVVIDYHPQPNGVHNTAWWPEVKDDFEAFVRDHPRKPLPDFLTWESTGTPFDNRADWLIIDKVGPPGASDASLDDLNVIGSRGETLFDNVDPSGRVDLLRSGNTVKARTRGVQEFTLLLSPDMFDLSQPVRVETNGRVAFEGKVAASVATLVQWAAHDNDRTMLFGAELHVTVR